MQLWQRPTAALALFAPLAATLAVVTYAHAEITRVGDAKVTFTATGPAGLSIVGTTSELSVAETERQVVVTVPLRQLDTKIDLRNRHMRDKYLEVAKYPDAELRVDRTAVAAPAGKATGTLTLHGRSKPVVFSYATKPEGALVAVTGSLRLDTTDFGIAKAGYAGVTVKPGVDVNVAFRVKKD